MGHVVRKPTYIRARTVRIQSGSAASQVGASTSSDSTCIKIALISHLIRRNQAFYHLFYYGPRKSYQNGRNVSLRRNMLGKSLEEESGGVAEWQSGRVAEWQSGGVAEWRRGGVAQ